jgi:hypothetical protein
VLLDGDKTIDVADGIAITASQTASSILTIQHLDITKVCVVSISKQTTVDGLSFSIANAIYEEGIALTPSATTLKDSIAAMYVPAIGKWLATQSDGYSQTTLAKEGEDIGGEMRFVFTPRAVKKPTGKVLFAMNAQQREEFAKKGSFVPTSEQLKKLQMALADGQECVVDSSGRLMATDIVFDKATNSYPNRMELQDTSKYIGYIPQTVTSSAGALSIDYTAGNCVYFEQTENITSINIVNLPAGGTATTVKLIRKHDATSNILTMYFDSSVYYGQTADAPVLTQMASAIDVITLKTKDGGLTWTTVIQNNFF